MRGPGGRSRGKQIYLGGYDSEEQAGRAYDMAAIVYFGQNALLNHPWQDYEADLHHLTAMSKEGGCPAAHCLPAAMQFVLHILYRSSRMST